MSNRFGLRVLCSVKYWDYLLVWRLNCTPREPWSVVMSYLPCGFPTVWRVTTQKIDNNNSHSRRDSWEEEDHTKAPHNFTSLVSQNNPPSKQGLLSVLQIEGKPVWEAKGLDQSFSIKENVHNSGILCVKRHTFCVMITLSTLWKLIIQRWKSRQIS